MLTEMAVECVSVVVDLRKVVEESTTGASDYLSIYGNRHLTLQRVIVYAERNIDLFQKFLRRRQ